jgi:cytochrome P450
VYEIVLQRNREEEMSSLANIHTLVESGLPALGGLTILSSLSWGGMKLNELFAWRSRSAHIPGPPASLLSGNVPELQQFGGFHNYLPALHQQYGPVVKFWLGPSDLIVSFSDPDHLAQVANLAYTPKLLQKPMEWMGDVFWIGKPSNDPQKVKRARAKLTPLLMGELLVHLCSTGREYVKRMLEHWATKTALIDAKDELGQVLFNATGRSIFGQAFDQFSSDLEKSLAHIIQGTQERLEETVAPIWKYSYWEWKRHVSRLHKYVQFLIDQAKQDPNLHAKKDLVSLLLRQKDEDGSLFFSNGEIRGYLVDLLFDSGLQATPSALTWVCYILTQYPEVQAKAQDEVDRVLEGRFPEFEELQKLEYLTQVIKETMRVYTPVSSTMRLAHTELEIGGYHIPKGTSICIPICVIHKDEKFWQEPEKFIPERFESEASKHRHRYAYLPFGFGPRGCIGARYSIVEMQWVMSMILQRFSLSLSPGQQIFPEMRNLALQPKSGLKLLVQPRT